MIRKEFDLFYEVQHFSFLRGCWSTIDTYAGELQAKRAAESYDGVMRVLCSNSTAKVPVYACVRMKGQLVRIW